jgi:hypothetical protein
LGLAGFGFVIARRKRAVLLILLASAFIAACVVSVSYAEPRYHTPADLGVVVLAAVAIDRTLTQIDSIRAGAQ